MWRWMWGLGVLLTAGVALAEPIDSKAARKMLFSPKGVKTELVEGALNDQQTALMKIILKGMKGEGLANYYGAIAVSPRFFEMVVSNPLPAAQSGLFQVVERRHSIAAAESIALEACRRAARAANVAPCVLAARILPKNFRSRDLTLSVTATADFRDYRKAKAPKAFAISPRSRAFAFAHGDGAQSEALAACNAAVEEEFPKDCVIVIAD